MSNTAPIELRQAQSLRNLYFSRTAVQLLWAGIVLATAASNPALAAGLLILYPLWDVACTVYDLRSSTQSGSPTAQYLNLALGSLATIGIALTAFKSPQQAVVIFGGWAFAAGLAQLAVGISPETAGRAVGNDPERPTVRGGRGGLHSGRTPRQDTYQRRGRLRDLRQRLRS